MRSSTSASCLVCRRREAGDCDVLRPDRGRAPNEPELRARNRQRCVRAPEGNVDDATAGGARGEIGGRTDPAERYSESALLVDGLSPNCSREIGKVATQAGLGTAGAERREARRFPMDSLERRDRAKRGNGSSGWTRTSNPPVNSFTWIALRAS